MDLQSVSLPHKCESLQREVDLLVLKGKKKEDRVGEKKGKRKMEGEEEKEDI